MYRETPLIIIRTTDFIQHYDGLPYQPTINGDISRKESYSFI